MSQTTRGSDTAIQARVTAVGVCDQREEAEAAETAAAAAGGPLAVRRDEDDEDGGLELRLGRTEGGGDGGEALSARVDDERVLTMLAAGAVVV